MCVLSPRKPVLEASLQPAGPEAGDRSHAKADGVCGRSDSLIDGMERRALRRLLFTRYWFT